MDSEPLPAGWICLPVGDPRVCTEIRPGFACGKKETEGGVPHLRMNNIASDGRTDFALIRRVPREVAEKAGRYLEKGDVLFCNTNSTELVGKTCLFPGWKERCTFSNHLTQLRTNGKTVLPAWLFVVLRHYWLSGFFATNCREFVGQSAYNQDKLRELLAPIPPLEEQRRIVARIEEVWSRIGQALHFHHAAVEAQESLLQTFVDRAFADVPEDGWIPIGNHAKLQNGFAFKSGDFQSSGIRLLRNQNIYHDWIDWSDARFLSQEQAKAYSVFELREGDVILTLNRPIISTGIKAVRIRASDLPSLMVQRVGRFHCDGHLDKDYLFHFLTSTFFKDELGKIEEGGGVPSFTQRHIHPIRIPVRPIAKQRRIAASLDHLRREIPRLAASLQEIDAEICSFMPAVLAKAFRGEL